jgi:aspartate-semialdehyde dehydrogenase
MKIAVVGATDLGSEILKVLCRNFPTEIIPVPERSGKTVNFKGTTDYKVVTYKTAIEMKPDVAIFSAGGGISLELFCTAEAGIT